MGFTKRHLESLPEVKQNEILGTLSEDDEWEYHDAREEPGIRNFVSGDTERDRVTRWLVENGFLEI